MPKQRNETLVKEENGFKTMRVEVGERGEKKHADYVIPSDAVKFQEWVLSLSNKPEKEGAESPLALVYRRYVTAECNAARSAVYESIASESTKITVGSNKIDLMDFAPVKFVRGYNGMVASVEVRTAIDDSEEGIKNAERAVGFGPWKAAAKKFLEAGTVRINDATKVMEVVAA